MIKTIADRPEQIKKVFTLKLSSFSMINSNGELFKDVSIDSIANDHYGCGIMEFSK